MCFLNIIIYMIIVNVNTFFEDFLSIFNQNEHKVLCRLLERGFGAKIKKPPEKSGGNGRGSVGFMLKTYPGRLCPANIHRLLRLQVSALATMPL